MPHPSPTPNNPLFPKGSIFWSCLFSLLGLLLFFSPLSCSSTNTQNVYRTITAPVSHASAVVQKDGSIRLQVEGSFTDQCAAFDRFHTRREGQTLFVAVQGRVPSRGCARGEVFFRAVQWLTNLPVGRYQIKINQEKEILLAVPPPPSTLPPQKCEEQFAKVETLQINSPVPQGEDVTLSYKARLPNICWEPLAIQENRQGSNISLQLKIRRCHKQSSCPPLSQEISGTYTLQGLAAGLYSIEMNGTRLTPPLEVVPAAQCKRWAARLHTIQITTPPTEARPGVLRLSGQHTVPCSHLAPPVLKQGWDSLLLRLDERMCQEACPRGTPQSNPAILFDYTLPLLPPGEYQFDANGLKLRVTVIPKEAYRIENLTAQTIALHNAKTQFKQGTPVDIHVSGTLPNGCYQFQGFVASLQKNILQLTPQAERFGLTCKKEVSTYRATLTLFALQPGSYQIKSPKGPSRSFQVLSPP